VSQHLLRLLVKPVQFAGKRANGMAVIAIIHHGDLLIPMVLKECGKRGPELEKERKQQRKC
jgi:hypothetical protein